MLAWLGVPKGPATPSAVRCRKTIFSISQNRSRCRTAVPLAALSVATIIELTKCNTIAAMHREREHRARALTLLCHKNNS